MTTNPPKASLGLVLLAALALAVSASIAVAAPPDDRYVLSVGHTDAVAPHHEEGGLRLRVKDDTETHDPGVVVRDPAEVIFHAKPEAMQELPAGLPPSYEFLGEAGETVWVLPQTQDPELLWPGFSSETIGEGELQGDEIGWNLLGVEGPGSLMVWVTAGLGEPEPIFLGDEPLPQTEPMPVLTHAHFNWGFDAEGLYTLTFEATANADSDGAALSSGPTLYRFFVGDLAELPEIPLADVSVVGLEGERAAGETVTLTAAQSPETGLADYRWSRRCGEELALTPVGEGTQLDFTATLADDGCEYFVTLHSGADPVAISAPATLSVREPDPEPDPDPSGDEKGGDERRSDPEPSAAGGRPPASAPRRARSVPRLWLSGARLRGRALALALRLGTRSRVVAVVTRGGGAVARTPVRLAGRRARLLRLPLPHTLRPGRYGVRVAAASGGRRAVRAIHLRVRWSVRANRLRVWGSGRASRPGRGDDTRG